MIRDLKNQLKMFKIFACTNSSEFGKIEKVLYCYKRVGYKKVKMKQKFAKIESMKI